MILPLADIVKVAIRLNGLARDISFIEMRVDAAEGQYPTAAATVLPGIYDSIGHQTAMADIAYQGVLAAGAMLKDADGTSDEAAEVIEGLRREHAEARDRILALRSRLRELYGPLGEAATRLRDQTLDERLLRILPADGDFDLTFVEQEVRRDHHEIADAIAAWRTMNDPRPILYVAGSSTRDEIRSALNRLTSKRCLALRRSLTGVRWERLRVAAKAA